MLLCHYWLISELYCSHTGHYLLILITVKDLCKYYRTSYFIAKRDPKTLDPHVKKVFCELSILANQILNSEYSKRNSWTSLETQQFCIALWAMFPSANGASHPSNFDGKLPGILVTCLCSNYSVNGLIIFFFSVVCRALGL